MFIWNKVCCIGLRIGVVYNILYAGLTIRKVTLNGNIIYILIGKRIQF